MSREKVVSYSFYWCDHCDDETEHRVEETDRLSPLDRDVIFLVTCTKCGNAYDDL